MTLKHSINIQYLNTTIGELILGAYQGCLCLLDFRYRKMRHSVDLRLQQGLAANYIECSEPILEQAKLEIKQYLSGQRLDFELPLVTVGTEFQKLVWQALQTIPYGSTASYLELAQQIGKPKAVRAVANANGANAIGLIIPCHRIIGSDGSLVGYGGGLSAKKKLLAIEYTNTRVTSR